MSSKWLGGILGLGILAGVGTGAARLRAAPPSDLALVDVIVVTEDVAERTPGCDAVSVFSLSRSVAGVERIQSLVHGSTRTSPGRLAATSDLSLIVAAPTNIDRQLQPSFLYELVERSSPSDKRSWTTQDLESDSIPSLGAVAILPDDQTLLVAEAETRLLGPPFHIRLAEPPFRVAKYDLKGLRKPAPKWGLRLGEAQIDGLAVEILPTRDGQRVNVLTDRNTIFTIDPQTMLPVAPEIRLAPIKGITTMPYGTHAPYLQHATVSGDGKYLFTNRGLVRELSVADLESRTAWTIPLVSTGQVVGGVAWNSGWFNANLLVVHTFDRLILYRFAPPNGLHETGRIAINRPYISGVSDISSPDVAPVLNIGPILSVAWTGSGRYIVAATDNGHAEFEVIKVSDEGSRLQPIGYLTACLDDSHYNGPNDIFTTNGLVFPSPTPSPTSTVTPTPSPTLTPSATATPIPSVTSSATATPVPSLTSTPYPITTPSPSSTPRPLTPIYLPIMLTETCTPGQRRADVLLVIDTSSSMLELTSAGRPKIDAAREAAGSFIDLLQLPSDQAGLVWFNETAGLAQPLTGDRTALRVRVQALETAGRIEGTERPEL